MMYYICNRNSVEGITLKGFHANYKDICERFIKDELALIVSEDTEYLGRGMYFWDHESNARYWKEHKKRDKESAIISADINLGQRLDLTDDDICSELSKICSTLEAVSPVKHFGKQLDYLFEAFKLPYTVIKGREYKRKKKENPFLNGTQITTKSVDIYCVKDAKAINSKEWVSS